MENASCYVEGGGGVATGRVGRVGRVVLSLIRPLRPRPLLLLHGPHHPVDQLRLAPRHRVRSLLPLPPAHEASLASQVKRMLRLLETDERTVWDFRMICQEMDVPDCIHDFDGTMFQSPTVFEDRVKSILLCNCQAEQKFCKLSDMALSDYGLITASNVKPKKGCPKKRKNLA